LDSSKNALIVQSLVNLFVWNFQIIMVFKKTNEYL
jgi:hypothetical protein